MNKPVPRFLVLACSLICLATSAGCGVGQSPEFHSNMVEMVKYQIPEPQQQDIADILMAMYGTPDVPFRLPETGLDLNKLQMAAGPVHSDEFGRETGLYRRHCAHCHGTTGDALGPTAEILNPYPRDYRQGKFKFKSTERPDKPTDYDLETVVRNGVPGTAMPSFDLLPDVQIKSLVEYVKYLSLRGETEIRLIIATADLSEGKLETTRAMLVDEILTPLSETWKTSAEKIIFPPEKPELSPETLAKGREIFYGTAGNCAKCHGWSALGDGQTTDYDDWNKTIADMDKDLASDRESLPGMSGEQHAEVAARIATISSVLESDALPLRTIKPRNLRQSIYRGGRAPVELYRRIYAGINGVPMPAAGPTSPGGPGMKPDEIWALVDYVRSLPYEAISEPPRQQRHAVEQARF